MGTKGAEKIIDALNQLMEGYCELQESVERDYGSRPEGEGSDELSSEVDAAMVTELRAAIESVMEDQDYSAEELASVISMLTDSLEEIDPDVFDHAEEETAEDEDDDDDYEEDEDDDLEEEDDDSDDDEEE